MTRFALDLFAGMGGASLGIDRAGFECYGLEINPDAIALHQGHWVDQVDVAAAEPADETPHPSLDLLWASPPCQPFSTAGLRRGLADPRGQLMMEVPRWVLALRPRWVVCEQVRAALPWWQQFAEMFVDAGYGVWTGLVHAEQFGLPQTRTRAVLMASLGAALVGPPRPTHRRYHSNLRATGWVAPGDAHLPMWRPMSDIIDADAVGFPRRGDIDGEAYRSRDFRSTDLPAFTLTGKARSWTVVNTGADWKTTRADAQQRTLAQPAPTLTGKSGGQWHLGDDGRMLTVAEALGLQSFPMDCLDSTEGVSRTARFQAIADAVPPLLAQRIVEALGDPALQLTEVQTLF